MKKKYFLLMLTVVTLINKNLYAQQFDETFGNQGVVLTSINSINDYCNSIIQQNDGKIIAAGGTVINSDNDIMMAVVRYNSDGNPDNSFGVDGKVSVCIDSTSEVKSVLLQNDGKIILSGYSVLGTMYKFAMLRLNTDGSIDTTFGAKGIVTTAIDSFAVAFAAHIQSDGKIILAGKAWNGLNYDFALVRYSVDGIIDTTFGESGIVTTELENNDEIYAIDIQSDQKIIVAGITGNGYNYNFGLAKYNTDGSLDSGFGTNGIVISDLGTQYDIANSILLQSDGKIIVTGNVYGGGNNYYALARYNLNGTYDNSFGTNGVSISDSLMLDCISSSAMLRSDGKIILAGTTGMFTGNADFCIQQFTEDGSLDVSFGDNGVYISDLTSKSDFCNSAILQSDNKIILAGTSINENSVFSFSLARYIDISVNIDKLTNNKNCYIFPNPASDYLTIKNAKQNSTITIYDMTGKQLINCILENEQINVSELSKGFYMIGIKYMGHEMEAKFIKH